MAAEVAAGQFFLAEMSGEAAGAVRFQLEDQLFWPDLEGDDSAFIHRLVVRRRFKGLGVSTALMEWAAGRAAALGKRYLRLDCDASRQKLRAMYEQFGFRFHSFRQVGAYYVARYEYAGPGDPRAAGGAGSDSRSQGCGDRCASSTDAGAEPEAASGNRGVDVAQTIAVRPKPDSRVRLKPC